VDTPDTDTDAPGHHHGPPGDHADAAQAVTALYDAHAVSMSSNSVQWTDASGATLIVAWLAESTTFSARHLGVVSHGRYTPLPVPPGISLGTPPDIAW